MFWPYCTEWCKDEANAENEQTLWNYFYEEEQEDENSDASPLQCEFCYCNFYPTGSSCTERFCSNTCAARGAGMQKDEHTGVETLREQEVKPAGFATGKVYQVKIYNEEEPHDVIFLSRVVVQSNGTLKQLKGTVSLRKDAVFNSWLDWRSFCWPHIY